MFGLGPSAESGHRSGIRIRDPFVLPDRDARVYYIYGSTNRGLSPTDARKEVVVYRTADLDTWGQPITAWAVPATHWARETVWAPEVHRHNGRYYLFVTLTSAEPLPTPPGRPPNVRRGTEILVADRPEGPFEPLGLGSQTPHRTKTGRLVMLWSSYGPAALDEVVLSCLAKQPDQRPSSARQLAEAIAASTDEAWSEEEAARWWQHQTARPPQ